ncbi:Hypp4552 [Branchiostoma lanceolatum]|uniref:Hypp4552 protein n=1 Tax=Branchiostoma lanceolatum TaxID=7740 RepID=A0A8K0EW57_BRALA|nr:Hypp4552 [Branchiostoma lanceolatum]
MDSYLDYSESESESSSSEASSLSESASVPEFTWGFVTGKGGKTKKVGFICSYLEDKEWIPVKSISRVQGKPGTICVWFSQTTSNTGRPNDEGSGRKKNKEYVDLEDYVASKDSVWENLEGIKDAEQFARSYQVMQQRETQESADSSPGEEEDDSGPYDFQETPKSNKGPSKQSHNPKALEDKAPHPKYKTTSKGGSGRKPEWTPDKKKQKRKAHVNTPPSKKKILKRPYPGTNRSSSHSEEDGELAKESAESSPGEEEDSGPSKDSYDFQETPRSNKRPSKQSHNPKALEDEAPHPKTKKQQKRKAHVNTPPSKKKILKRPYPGTNRSSSHSEEDGELAKESAESSPGEEEDSGPSKDSYDFQETPRSNKRPSKQSHNPKALEDEAPHPKTKKQQKRKAHVNTPPSKKKILKRPYPGTNRSSSDSEEDGELAKDRQKCLKKTKTQKSKGKTPQNSKSSYPFRHEVSLMRAEHPELEGAREDQPLNKKDTWWRHELVPSVTSLINSEINSQRQAQLTVSTMSKRCYSLAEGIMDKWEAGVYQGQPSTEVKQTLFFCLNGLNKEQMVFDLLQKFHDGQFKHWKEFELAANAIKLEAKVTTEELSKAVEELRKEKQQWQQEKQRLTSEVGDGNEKEQCQQENQRLTSEVEELRKEKQQWQQEKQRLTSEVGDGNEKEQCQQENQRLTSEVEELRKEKQQWQQEKQRLTSEVGDGNEKEQCQQENQRLTSEVEELRKEKQQWQQEKQRLTSEVGDGNEKEQCQQENQRLTSEVEELRKEKQQWQQEKQRLTSEVGDGNEKEQCQQENQRLTSEVEELRKEKQQWQQEKQRLTSEVEKLKKEKQRWQQGDNHPSPEDPQDKKKIEEHEQEDLHQNRMPVLEQVKEGEWVAVWYGRGNKRTWYPGKVLNVDKEKTHTELKVEFLTHDRDSGKFKKPKFDDIQTVNNPVFVIGTNLKVKKVKGGTLYDVKEKDEIDNICKNVKTPVMND